MKKLKTIRFGAIGPGGMGRSRTANLAEDRAVEVVAAADANPQSIEQLENRLGHEVQRFLGRTGYKKMIDRAELDAVGVFSPHSLHYEQVMYALEHRKHVMVEKPMICGIGPALETAKLARKKGLVYLTTYQRRYHPVFVKARDLIRKGMIGEVTGFYVYMAQRYGPPPSNWRGNPKYSGGGQINDSGSHYQDILLWMTGLLPKSVEGHIDNYFHGRKLRIQLNGSFTVELANGAAGRLIIVGDAADGFSDDVKIVGAKGILVFQKSGLILKRPGKDPKPIPATRPRGYPTDPGDNFAKLLTGRTKTNHAAAESCARAVLLTDALLQAGKTGKRVYCERLVRKAGYSMRAFG